MTRVKFCGLTRPADIEAANRLHPAYIGFVFAKKSRRHVTPETAKHLKTLLASDIKAVGVFVNEKPEAIAALLNEGVIDLAQLHGGEDENDIYRLRKLTDRRIIKAFRIKTANDLLPVGQCTADYVLLDSGAGTGTVFDWKLIQNVERPYFLAGGLSPDNVAKAIAFLHPFAVDVSSGIETGGVKDPAKMAAFAAAANDEINR